MRQTLASALICVAASLPTISADCVTPRGENREPFGALTENDSMIELPSTMFRRWGHSWEEDTKDVTIFRPSSFPFPPSRGRDEIEFRENGEFIHYRIGTTDRSEAVVGRWRVDRDKLIEVDFPTALQRGPEKTTFP
jgi:hypothetical protein